MISCILLAAGYSSRFGSPKALAQINQETVIECLQKQLIASMVDEVIIVLGAHKNAIEPYLLNHKKVKVVYNKNYNIGQTSSFKAGLHLVSADAKGIVLLPVDYPFIKKETINTLITFFTSRNPLLLIPTYQERKGHPPVFDIKLRKGLIALEDNVGVNSFIQHYAVETTSLSVNDPGVVLSFNTKKEFAQLKESYLFTDPNT